MTKSAFAARPVNQTPVLAVPFLTVLGLSIATTPASAACTPAAADNVTATCTGATVGPDGYGANALINLTTTVVGGASVSGTENGITFSTGTVNNYGTIQGSGLVDPTNTGGVRIQTSGTVNNFAGASILGPGRQAILAQDLVLNNSGTVAGLTYGALIGGTSTIQNNQGGTISGAVAIWSQGAISLVNAGTLTGGPITQPGPLNSAGVVAATAGGTVTNTATGVINGGDFGIFSRDTGITVTNLGVITGYYGIATRDPGSTTIFNAGTITALGGDAITSLTGNATLTLTVAPTSVINGNVLGGVGAPNVLQFGGEGSGTFDTALIGPAAQYQNFTTINVLGPATWSLTGTSTYTGPVTVSGGTLAANGNLASVALTTVNAGGTLGGSGTIGNTTIAGGTLAPGNSVGTLTVQGNLAFTAAATYLVEVSGASADLTNVTGNAILGGGKVVAQVSSPTSQKYTILNAASGVSGTFGSVVATQNFTASLSYDLHNVYLNLQAALGNGLGPQQLNPNQQNVAGAINNAFNKGGVLPAGFLNLFNLSGQNLANALTQLSGETAVGNQQTVFQATQSFMDMMIDPAMGSRGMGVPQGGANSFADESMAYAAKRQGHSAAERDAYAAIVGKAPPRPLRIQMWNVWAAGYGGVQSNDGDPAQGTTDVRSRAYGGVVGLDYRVAANTHVGFAMGGAGTKYDLGNGLGSGRSDIFQVGLYGRHEIGAAYIAGALSYAWQDVTTDRIALLNSYRANFDASAVSGRLESGYRFAFGQSGLTPYAAGQFTTFWLPNYAERTLAGVNTFALAYAEQSVTAPRTDVGLRADTSFTAADAIVTLRGRAAWAHNFNTTRDVTATFQSLLGATFVVNGAAQARDAALVSAGAEARWLNGWSLAAMFEGEFSSISESYAGKGVVRYQW